MVHKPISFIRVIILMLCLVIFSTNVSPFESDSGKDEIEQLYTLAKVYGYVRYFYSGDEASRIDWDKFAFLCSKQIVEQKQRGIKQNLESLFIPIAPGISFHDKNYRNTSNESIPQNLKPIYWQHLGDGKGSVGYPYQSLRVNRQARILPDSPNDYFTLRKILDPEQLKGKEVKLSIRLRSGAIYIGRPSIQIVSKANGKDQEVASSDGQPIGMDWSEHEVIKVLPDDLEKVVVVIQNVGMEGEVFFDDLVLQVSNGNQREILFQEDFNDMNLDDFTSTWRPAGPNNEASIVTDRVDRFVRINRARGKLGDHHPLFTESPLDNPVKVKRIGSGLVLRLPLVIYGTDSVTYPKRAIADAEYIYQQLELIDPSHIRAENLYTRLANTIILWNVLQHFYPAFQSVNVNWDEQLRIALRRSFSDKSFEDHRITLARMIEPLNDSHMTIYTAPQFQYYYPPIKWALIQNKIVVTHVLDVSLPISVGDIITSVNGVKAKVFWNEKRANVIGATVSGKNFKAINESLMGPKNSEIRIEYLSQGDKSEAITLQRELPQFEFDRVVATNSYTEFPEGIFYVNPTKMTWSDLKSHVDELASARGIVFDLRGYPRWETINIVSHFIQSPIRGMARSVPKILFPDQEHISYEYSPGDTIYPAKPYIGCPKVFITNGKALSYSEDFLNRVSYYKLAKVIGEPSAGATGSSNTTYLLGGLYNVWTGMKVFRQDGEAFNGVGIVPDEEVKPTIAGIRAGRDELLEYAISQLQVSPALRK
jgi:C-terminal processing protease CtpA/Prc